MSKHTNFQEEQDCIRSRTIDLIETSIDTLVCGGGSDQDRKDLADKVKKLLNTQFETESIHIDLEVARNKAAYALGVLTGTVVSMLVVKIVMLVARFVGGV